MFKITIVSVHTLTDSAMNACWGDEYNKTKKNEVMKCAYRAIGIRSDERNGKRGSKEKG